MVSTPIILTLTDKIHLTHDVYELVYSCENPLQILPGQFLLCDTAGEPKLRRSYSVSWAEGNRISFIIKRLSEGTGGSIAICDQAIGHKMQVWGPLGHFTLRETLVPKVFIGTGTGFAPLYFMMKSCFRRGGISSVQGTKYCAPIDAPIFFLFGVRELRDVFYVDQMQQWSDVAPFDYEIYCSRELIIPPGEGGIGGFALPDKHNVGRVTEYLTFDAVHELNRDHETEFYICGSPAMVAEVRSMLDLYGIHREKVFFEQY